MIRTFQESKGAGKANLAVFALFLLALLFFGGASRGDEVAQPIVRLAAIAVLAWAAFRFDREARARAGTIGAMFAALALLLAVQLVPLPPGLWEALPGRSLYADALATAGVGAAWRPLSLTPDLTLNALLGLLPAAAALAVVALIPRKLGPLVLALLLAAIAVAVLLAIFQVSTGRPYLYRTTNVGAAVGSFANRNHFALFVALALPLLAGWAGIAPRRGERPGIRDILALSCASAVFPILLIAGSRGGLICGAFAAAAALALVLISRPTLDRRKRGIVLAAGAAGIAAIIAVFVLFSRDEAFKRLLSGSDDDSRGDLTPMVLRMIGDYFPFGSGWGSFDPLYRMYESDATLDPTYANQAHNDLLQIAFEGGLPAAMLLAWLAIWFSKRSLAVWRNRVGEPDVLARVGSAIIATIALSSAFDYPLRTPLLATIFVVAGLWLAPAPRVGTDDGGSETGGDGLEAGLALRVGFGVVE